MILEIALLVVTAAAAFAFGVLFGRKNVKTVNAAVSTVTSAATIAEAAAKKL